jgi:hypothetical protein
VFLEFFALNNINNVLLKKAGVVTVLVEMIAALNKSQSQYLKSISEAPKQGDNFFKMQKVVEDKFSSSSEDLLIRILKTLAATLRNENAVE